ncbi:MAG: lipoprotein signal peptidase [Betaproteobacteria bacterium]|jgi:signal peptidase II|nr:lipoprotein signal peptidase [Betaproteobacteria bacterium]NBX05212.1 lipoprotein signal peptidase [Betaproteobacteria bacterium]
MARRGGAGGFKLLHWLALALVLVLADQITKVWIAGTYALGEGTPVTGFFNIVRVHNSGAAFSFLADAGGWQRWMFAGLSAGASLLIAYLLHSHAGQRLFCFALACVLGGAVGNLIDRVVYGYVIDFLDFYAADWHFPAFNLADSAITLGAACLILDELLRVRRAG